MARSFACGTEGARGVGVSLTASRLGAVADFAPGFVGLAAFPVAAVGLPLVGLAGGSGAGFPAPFGVPFFSALVAAVRCEPLTAEAAARTDAVRALGFAGRVSFAADLAGFFVAGLVTTRAAGFAVLVDFAGFDDLTGFALAAGAE